MRRGLVAALLAMVTAPAMSASPIYGASTWPVQGHDALGTNANPDDHAITASNVAHLHRAWVYPHVISAVATDTRVYTITSLGRLSSRKVVILNARTGSPLRTLNREALYQSKRQNAAPQALAVAGGRLLVSSGAATVALNPDTGQVYWRTAAGANWLTVAGTTLYTGQLCQASCGAASYAISLQTGRVLWRHSENGGMQPMLIGGHLYQVWGSRTRIYDERSGHLLASLPFEGQWMGDGARAYAFVSPPPALAAPKTLKAWVGRIGPTGKPAWKIDLGVPADPSGDGQAALADHTLYVPSKRRYPGVAAVNPDTGQVRWEAGIDPRFDLVAANHLLFATHISTGKVEVLDGRTGRILRRFAVPAFTGGEFGTLLAGGTLYVVDSGGIVALRP